MSCVSGAVLVRNLVRQFRTLRDWRYHDSLALNARRVLCRSERPRRTQPRTGAVRRQKAMVDKIAAADAA
jgi:hypothetical protein